MENGIIIEDISECWHYLYKDGNLHRDEIDPKTGLSLPAMISANGEMHWYKENKKHRDEIDPKTGLSLPAVICVGGSMFWYKEGKFHRIDGPAYIERAVDGNDKEKWYLNGVEIKKENHPWLMAQKDKKELEKILKIDTKKEVKKVCKTL